jgi:phosphoribosylformimino-5-aminoimidazole carboxamide ribotide isomerase
MLVIPAIDLKDGKVVRLSQGRYEEFIVYSHDPVETAKSWQKQGAQRLHLIDLDGAFSGTIKNMYAIREVIDKTEVPVQFGGGLRTREDIAAILSIGAQWAILGTQACEDLDFLQNVVAEFGEQIMVSIDVKYKKVATHGWTQMTDLEDVELIKRLQDIGVSSFIYTDISRDGTLTGSNFKEVQRVLDETGASIFYSGGISSLEDVKNLRVLESRGLAGMIIGKALYEAKLPLTRAIAMAE